MKIKIYNMIGQEFFIHKNYYKEKEKRKKECINY